VFLEGEAYLIRAVDFSETSLIVTCFGPMGRFQALAKGARRDKSSFRSTFDILSLNKVKAVWRRDDTLGTLAECTLLSDAQTLAGNPAKFAIAEGILELLRLLTHDFREDEPLFLLTKRLLRILKECAPERAQNYWMGYLLQALFQEGILPDFMSCSRSGKPLLDGYLLCERQHPELVCRDQLGEEEHAVYYLRQEEVRLFQLLLQEPMENLRFHRFEPRVVSRLLTATRLVAEAAIEWRIRSFGPLFKALEKAERRRNQVTKESTTKD